MTPLVKNSIQMPLWVFFVLFTVGGLGWMVGSFQFARIPENEIGYILGTFGFEVGKAAFLGASAGALIKLILDQSQARDRYDIQKFGVEAIHSSRFDAREELLKTVKNSKTRKVWIAGISLRDFLGGGGILREVWQALQDRLLDEERKALPKDERLEVRLLMLDPNSFEGRFRWNVERGTIAAGGIREDVRISVDTVKRFLTLAADEHHDFKLEARLYDHGSFSFVFLTNDVAFIEQYSYRDHQKESAMPVLRFAESSRAYEELTYSFSTIWEHARPADIQEHRVRVASAVEEAHIAHLYRYHSRHHLSRRQIECIDEVSEGSVVKIQAITGHFYMQVPTVEHLEYVSKPKMAGGKGAEVRIIVISPISRQAILRAVADNSPLGEVGKYLRGWTWSRHKQSALYAHVFDAVRIVDFLRERGCNIELRMSSALISCALLLTERSVFVEQYLYGRSRRFEKGTLLGAEHPVVEYRTEDEGGVHEHTVERQIFESAFDVMWKSFSLSAREYHDVFNNEEETFNKRLRDLLSYLSPRSDDYFGPDEIRKDASVEGDGSHAASGLHEDKAEGLGK